MRVAVTWAFYIIYFITLALTIVIQVILFIIILRWLGIIGSSEGGFIGGLTILNMMLAKKITDRFFKALGLSRSGRMTEGRRPAAPSVFTPADDIIDIKVSRSLSTTLTCLTLGLGALLLILTEVIIPKHQQTGREAMPWLYGLLLGMASLGYGLRHFRLLRIDEQGVTANNTAIPWSDIATCKLVVIRDTLGDISLAYPALKDREGNELFHGLAASMGIASTLDQQKVLQIFKRRFPKLDEDPWEL